MVSASLQTAPCIFVSSFEERYDRHEILHNLSSETCYGRTINNPTLALISNSDEFKEENFLCRQHDQEQVRERNELRRHNRQQEPYKGNQSSLPLNECRLQERDDSLENDAKRIVALLKLCTRDGDLKRGKKLHDYILERGLFDGCSTALVLMYAKSGQLDQAKGLLVTQNSKNLISWTALISGLVQQGQCHDALDCFRDMQERGISPDAVTFASLLKACGASENIDQGKAIHNEILRQGLLGSDMVLGNTLLGMYVKCGALEKASCVLQELPVRDVVSWNTLIAGYSQQGYSEEASRCHKSMWTDGIIPDDVTYACILRACSCTRDILKGMQIHDELARRGLLNCSIFLSNTLVDMYAKCGALKEALLVLMGLSLRDIITWNTLIAGFAQNCQGEHALHFFELMQYEGILADAITYICVLNACGTIRAPDRGRQFHSEIIKRSLSLSNVAMGNALVDMYAKCGALEEAQYVLCTLQSRDVVSWSVLIAGYIEQGKGEPAWNCYECMQKEGILPDAITFSSLSKACSILGAIDKANQIYNNVAGQGLLRKDIVLGNALVDMYAKIGCLPKARAVLAELPTRDVFSWNALIAGYVQQGHGEEALECLKCMQQEGIFPNEVTFSCVLTVCSHLGLVEETDRIFEEMRSKYDLEPTLDGYVCMIDLFGRVGLLGKAVKLIQEMPSPGVSEIWHALLGACRQWANVHIGKWAFEQAVKLNKEDGAAYVLMADIYAAARMQVSIKQLAECGERSVG